MKDELRNLRVEISNLNLQLAFIPATLVPFKIPMRLWTVHPKYLDTKGLVAVWREALLAQKVLKGETKGYRNHPQLERFKSSADPAGAIAGYLRVIYDEAVKRGYQFNADKIAQAGFGGEITCTRGQLFYEWNHLKEKLRARDAAKYGEVKNIELPQANPIFRLVEGEVEAWEVIK